MNTNTKKLYAVLRMQKTVELKLFNGHKESVSVNGAEGFMPIYATIEEAREASNNGKYEVVGLEVPA
jgi:hypothetical protein